MGTKGLNWPSVSFLAHYKYFVSYRTRAWVSLEQYSRLAFVRIISTVIDGVVDQRSKDARLSVDTRKLRGVVTASPVNVTRCQIRQ